MKYTFLSSIFSLLFALSLAACSSGNVEYEASGTIEVTEVKISSQVVGTIKEILVDEGQAVKAGDILVKIDSEVYGAQRAQTMAQLSQAQENYRLAQIDAQRVNNLVAGGSASLQDRDNARTRLAVTENQLKAAEEALKLSSKSLSNSTVVAPFDGVILQKLVEAGELAMTGTGIATIADLNKLSLTVYIPEAQLGKVHLGDQVDVLVDSFPKKKFKGQIIFISPRAEYTPKNVQTKDERIKEVFAVKLDLGNGEGLLKPGMPADADFLNKQVTQ